MMNNRMKDLLVVSIKYYLKVFGFMALLFIAFLAVLLIFGNLFDGGDTPSIRSMLTGFNFPLLFSAVLIFSQFDQGFLLKLQNGFARGQIFKNDFWMITLVTVFVTVLNRILHLSWLGSNPTYNGFFTNPLVNFFALFIISFLGNYLLFIVAESLGAFLNLFSKKIRNWIAILIVAGFLFVSISLFSGAAFGVGMLVSNHVIDIQMVETILNLTMSVLFGFNEHGAWNPLNMIVTMLVGSGLLTWLARFIIMRVQIHRI
ncbi:hypothetical protein [Lactobacillus sp. Sy-1]|uniref:hypothetical protein n=1 Tax=Lactobacillus sp. Sy-1 TaxID=2109645 RepID=UPI001C594659|nr:hypothetical protein [Lactobacillus sp. Sy-1]MBW1605824.1 hypothetical protein [Lactobacillus sp. Sy-1]